MKSGETSDPNAPTRPPKIWVLADERRGTANQALGVADALGLDYEIKDITHSSLARLPNFLLGASRLGLSRELRPSPRPNTSFGPRLQKYLSSTR